MKKLAIVIICLLLGGAAAAWYFMRNTDAARDVLPSDASFVATFDPVEFTKECGFNLLDLIDLAPQLFSSDTKSPGIDLTKPAYFFVSPVGVTAIALNVNNIDKLEQLLTSTGFACEEQQGFKWVNNDKAIGCIDSKKVLFFFSLTGSQDNLRSEMIKLMKQSRQEGPVIDRLTQQQGFLRVCFSCEDKNFKKAFSEILPDFKDAYVNAALRAGDRDLTLSAKLIAPKSSPLLDNERYSLRPIQGNLADFAPADPTFWFCANLRGETILNYMKKNYIKPQWQAALIALNVFFFDADLMLKAIDGDVSIVVPKLDLEHPQFLLTATLNNTDFLKNSDDWEETKLKDAPVSFKKRSDTDYTVTYEGQDLYFGVRNNCLYCTTSMELADNACQKTDADDLMATAKGKYLNASLDATQLIKSYAPMALMLGAAPQLYETVDAIDQLVFTCDDPQNIKLSLTTKKPVKEIVKNLQGLLTGK